MHLLYVFVDIRESFQVFYKCLDFLEFDTFFNWIHVYTHIRYLTSLPIFLHYFTILLKQSLVYTSITPDTPPRRQFSLTKSKDQHWQIYLLCIASKLWKTVPTNLKWLSTSGSKKWDKFISSNVSHSFELPIKIHFVVVFWLFLK